MISDSSSQGSGRSLRSKGHIDDGSDLQEPGSTTVVRSRKPAAYWNQQEEEVFLQFLCDNISASGDGGFKSRTFYDAALHLKKKFPQQKGAEKTTSVCRTKWQSVCSRIYHMSRMTILIDLPSSAQVCLQRCCRNQENFWICME